MTEDEECLFVDQSMVCPPSEQQVGYILRLDGAKALLDAQVEA